MGELITEKQLCEWLSISHVTAWKWRSKKGMPYVGTRKSIRYNKEEVLKWLENQKQN